LGGGWIDKKGIWETGRGREKGKAINGKTLVEDLFVVFPCVGKILLGTFEKKGGNQKLQPTDGTNGGGLLHSIKKTKGQTDGHLDTGFYAKRGGRKQKGGGCSRRKLAKNGTEKM